MLINAASLSAIYTGVSTAFNEQFGATESEWQKIATLVPSTTAQETYGWLGQLPSLREWVGDRHIKNLTAHAYTIVNRKFESTVAIGRDKIEDDTYGVLTPLFKEMGHAAATHPDSLVFELLANGLSTDCYDGQPFFDADHPVSKDDLSATTVSAY